MQSDSYLYIKTTIPLLLHSLFHIMTTQWVYASGSTWVSFDSTAQQIIESLWKRNVATWINCQPFHGMVYIDTSEMVLHYNNHAYTIARRKF